jgi:uracil-DNA glycosylase
LLGELKNVQLTLLIGQYAQRAFLKDQQFIGLTDSVREYQRFLPEYFPLPHPSPRNNGWLTKHPWFRDMVLPALKERTKAALEAS